jgi:hypothetical protein
MKLRIVPYKTASRSAAALRLALRELGTDCKIVQRDSMTYQSKDSHLILNWGSASTPMWQYRPAQQILNGYRAIATAANKLEAFKAFRANEVSTPEWTTDYEEALEWINGNSTVVCRTLLSATNGDGIVLASTEDALVPAPLYVKYKKKIAEFRVHVFNGEVIDVQQKRKRSGV